MVHLGCVGQKLDKEGYKLTKNQTYVDATINGLYDVLNNMVIDLHLTPYSEQKAYYEQIPNLQKGDIVIQLGDSIVTDMMSYMRALSVFDTGDKTTVMVKRGNKEVRSVIEF